MARSATWHGCASVRWVYVWPWAQCEDKSQGVFFRRDCELSLAGCVGGLILGFFLSRFLKDMLYGVTALDPLTYAGVVCIIVCVAALASLLPALRAARVEPVRVLREE